MITNKDNGFRLPVEKENLGPGDWNEMLSAFYDAKSPNPEEMNILYVAKFGIFSDPKAWGRLMGSMVRTIAAGEIRNRGLNQIEIERVEAQIVEGFNDVLFGTDIVQVSNEKQIDTSESQKNWNPEKIDWPFDKN